MLLSDDNGCFWWKKTRNTYLRWKKKDDANFAFDNDISQPRGLGILRRTTLGNRMTARHWNDNSCLKNDFGARGIFCRPIKMFWWASHVAWWLLGMLCPSMQKSSKSRNNAVITFFGNEGIHIPVERLANALSVNAVMLKPSKRCGNAVYSNSKANAHGRTVCNGERMPQWPNCRITLMMQEGSIHHYRWSWLSLLHVECFHDVTQSLRNTTL